MSSPLSEPSSPLSRVTADDLIESLRALLKSSWSKLQENSNEAAELLSRYDEQAGKCDACESENCSHLLEHERKCCPDCTCRKPALSDVEQAALAVYQWWSGESGSEDDWYGAPTSMEKLRDALRKRGAL